MPQTTATMNRGCTTMSHERPRVDRRMRHRRPGNFEKRQHDRGQHRAGRLAEKVAREQIRRQQSLVKMTSCGPITAANTPPASTQDTALGRNCGLAVSAAAKR